MPKDSKSTLSTGKYSIEQTSGAAVIYALNEDGVKEWVASTVDLLKAMEIVEGLVLVEMKRFYYPESKPQINPEDKETLLPAFLRKSTS